jgi:hypothetical protein
VTGEPVIEVGMFLLLSVDLSVPVSAYLAQLRGRSPFLKEADSGAHDNIHWSFANTLLMEHVPPPKLDLDKQSVTLPPLAASEGVNEGQRSMMEHWECCTDIGSVSTDTRSFRQTARRVNQNLAIRKLTSEAPLGSKKKYTFSDTMSISTNESWKFHRVANFPDDRESPAGMHSESTDHTKELTVKGDKSDVDMCGRAALLLGDLILGSNPRWTDLVIT